MPTFTNQALLSFNGILYPSNVVTGEYTQSLTMTKLPIDDTYTPDGSVTYIISIVNSGACNMTNLTLTDDLGAYSFSGEVLMPLTLNADSVTYFVNGVLQPADALTITAGPPFIASGIDVPAGGNAIIAYEAVANEFASGAEGAVILNTATLSGDDMQTTISDTATVHAASTPQLAITKALFPETITSCEPIRYTFLIQNSGNTPVVATDDLLLFDTFQPRLTNISVTLNGVPLVEGIHYQYDEETGSFTTLPGALPVEAAEFIQNPVTGVWTVQPGQAALVVTGTI